MFQQIFALGNLGNDPEMRYTGSGTAVAHFDLAVNKEWTDSAGERQSKTVWMRVTVWRALAENCAKYLSKGKRVLVVGVLEEASAFIDREGNARASNEVTATRVTFLSPLNNGQGDEANAGDADNAAAAQPSEDVPF